MLRRIFQIRLDVLVDQLTHRIKESAFPGVCLSDSRTFESLNETRFLVGDKLFTCMYSEKKRSKLS